MKKVSIIALAALVLAGCGQKKDSQSQAQQAALAAQPKAQTVKVQPAARQEVKQDGTYSATVQAFAELEILRKKEFPPALTETIETLEKTGYDDRNISDVWKLVRQRNTYRRIIHAAVRLCRFIEKIRS